MSEVLTPIGALAGTVMTAAIKFFAPAIGALLVVAVDPPNSRKELFLRFFVAFTFSFLFSATTFDLLHSFSWLAFLDKANDEHQTAIKGLLGACGWFVVGGSVQLMKKFREKPVETVEEVKKVVS